MINAGKLFVDYFNDVINYMAFYYNENIQPVIQHVITTMHILIAR